MAYYQAISERVRGRKPARRGARIIKPLGPVVPDGPTHAVDPPTGHTLCGRTPGSEWRVVGSWDASNIIEKCDACRDVEADRWAQQSE